MLSEGMKFAGVAPHLIKEVQALEAEIIRLRAESAVKEGREPATDGSDYKTKLVFTKHDMDREAARLGALIELHMDDSTKLLKMLGVCNDAKENTHWRYRKECFVDFDKVAAVKAERDGQEPVAKRCHACREVGMIHCCDPAHCNGPWSDKAEDMRLVETVTKAILFQDSGSSEGWEENSDLGEAAIAAYRKATPPAAHDGQINRICRKIEEYLDAIPPAAPVPEQASAAVPEDISKDAERYCWLKSRMVGVNFDWDDEGMTALAFEMPDNLSFCADCDKNIDAAMLAASQPEVKS